MSLTLNKPEQFFRTDFPTNGHSTNGHQAPNSSLVLDGQLCWSAAGGFIHSTALLQKQTEKLGLVQPQETARWTAIGTYADLYWNRVKHGMAWKDIPAKTQFLIWELKDGRFGILLPLLCGDYVTTLQGEKGGVRLIAATGRNSQKESNGAVAYAAVGKNIHALVESSLRAVAAHSKSFRLREDKKVPPFVDYLGWCSWDAFYSKVTEQKFLSALLSFRKGGVNPGFTILDDGWLENEGDLLLGFAMNGDKFPSGLTAFVRKVKDNFGVKYFGVWHAFNGYWGGVDPKGPLGKRYDVLKSVGYIRPWEGDKQYPLYLVDPRQAARFFTEFHDILSAGGVDLIKVDGQSALSEFTRPHFGRVSSMRSYQQALQSSVVRHFDGSMIHCMSNGLDVAYHLEQTLVWRNSDDFFPKKTSSAQQIHVHTNALNNLWTSMFALPDWDMFQSHNRWAGFHAAARALSGGPVYVCDKPGKQNFQILNQLASSSGRIWRCDRPALPAPESVFTDCRMEPMLLKIHNHSGASGLIGFFHCSELKKRLKGTYSPSDVPELAGNHFIARHYSSGRVKELRRDDAVEITLPRMGFEIVTLAPVLQDWLAALGRVGRYTGATSIAATTVNPRGEGNTTVRESGSFLFWCSKEVRVTNEAGEALRFKYAKKTQLLTVEVEAAGSISITPLG